MKILVTGATGYVGSRLVPRLLADGHAVRVAVADDPTDLPWWSGQVEVTQMDVLDPDAVSRAVAGVDAVFYLIHGMGGDDFVEQDRRGARNMTAALDRHDVSRVVYLSGIVPPVPREDLSDHIASRLEVEDILAGSNATSIALRAAILLGSGSTSFEIVRQVSERMPVQTLPTWMDSAVQPIAVVDALEALAGALNVDCADRSFDVGGPDRLRYSELLDRYAAVTGIRRAQVEVPLVPEQVVQKAAGRLVDVPAPVVESLIESLRHDMVCHEEDFRTALLPAGHVLLGVEEAIRRSLADAPDDPATADPMAPLPHDPDWAGGGREDSLGSKLAAVVSRAIPDRD
ncbi:NAD(P)H-binding protein [Flexivirga caeni]|uniref:NAD-dependent epimerase/dehydratase family protein n=1 Tax=Flexivirga caeni TaxID=2294115 RepID=A0A3M9M6X1_9MICO|nr:NAD(P)H-binding protein [Flexivirga caeni]RNI21310.1 NAD-dependent epimerase/dehydratase family protein [Flexivirga caeni]